MPASKHKVYYLLIVDDDSEDHKFLRSAIAKVIPQAIVESLYDGEELSAFLNTRKRFPGLVFLDVNMVKQSGRTTLHQIRNNADLKHVPVVVMTSSKDDQLRDTMMDSGASDFYTKPRNMSELVGIVQTVANNWLS